MPISPEMLLNDPLEGELSFPQSIDIRIIHTPEEAVFAGLDGAFSELNLAYEITRREYKEGGKYAKATAVTTFESHDQMHELYRKIASIPGVKAVL